MKPWRLFLLICRVLVVISCASAQVADQANSSSQLNPGVLIEKVAKNSAAEKAGIQAGDVLLTWARADVKGQIESPFDLAKIETEQAPRGSITVSGLRGKEQLSWAIGPDVWGIQARPDFQGTVRDLYLKGQELSAAGKTGEAATQWKAAAEEALKSRIGWLGPWMADHAAGVLSNARQDREADEAYQQGVQMASGVGPDVMAQLLQAWADSFRRRSDWEKAEKYYLQAVAEAEKSGTDELTVARNLDRLGSVAFNRGDLSKSEERFQQALTIRQKAAPESLPVAESFTSLSNLTWTRGDLSQAEDYLVRALHIRQRLAPESLKLAGSFHDLGRIAWSRGNFAEAEKYQLQALEIQQKLAPGSQNVSWSLEQLGVLALERGYLQKAEEYLNQSLDIAQKLAPESPNVASILNNSGIVAMRQGDLARAEEYYGHALAIGQRLVPGNPYLALVLNNLGIVMEQQGRMAKAEEYLDQALEIREKMTPESLAVAEILVDLGDLAMNRRDSIKAERFYIQALNITESLSPEGREAGCALQGLGDLARGRHDLEKAELYFNRAVGIREKLAPQSVDYAESLASLAAILREKKQPDAAIHLFGQALGALESQTTLLSGSQETRSEFHAKYSDYYQDYIDLLIAEGRPEEAFHVSERWRARSLLEMLIAARVDIHRGADPEVLDRERSLQASLNAKRDRRIQLLSGNGPSNQVEVVEKEIAALRAEYDQFESKIRETSPAYAALTQPQALTARAVQQLLEDDTLLLEYSLGKEHSYLWVLTPASLTVHQLPSRRVIESTARRLYQQISAPNFKEQREDPTGKLRQNRLAVTASALSRLILAPVAKDLSGKRLLIVADGALQYIPFAYLPEPRNRSGDPLILEHEIVYSPSASVLAELRRNANTRQPAPKAVAVLADPVFDREDPRVSLNHRPTQPRSPETVSLVAKHLTRSVGDVGLAHLARLPFSRREADAILALTPPGQGFEAVGFQASRATAMRPDLAEYRVIHFATHGLSDNQHPELSGLVLSLVDREGRPQNGFLDLQDIYNLNLPVELVVLSACETALGKEVQGEGLVGLTRGFMYAGAARVAASLWNTDDVSTRELMERFYRAMENKGMRPTAALRSAQIALWKQRRWRDPYYWAAFQIQGEWK